MKKTHNLLTLGLWIASFQLISFIMGQLSRSHITHWFLHIKKSPLTPPGITFAIVWPILYVILAYIGYSIFTQQVVKDRKVKIAFIIQMLLNWSWTPVFFILHETMYSLFALVAMLMLTGYLFVRFFQISKIIASLNLIYLAWLCFAFYLNFYIVLHN